jgi:hypothetical protein
MGAHPVGSPPTDLQVHEQKNPSNFKCSADNCGFSNLLRKGNGNRSM